MIHSSQLFMIRFLKTIQNNSTTIFRNYEYDDSETQVPFFIYQARLRTFDNFDTIVNRFLENNLIVILLKRDYRQIKSFFNIRVTFKRNLMKSKKVAN